MFSVLPLSFTAPLALAALALLPALWLILRVTPPSIEDLFVALQRQDGPHDG